MHDANTLHPSTAALLADRVYILISGAGPLNKNIEALKSTFSKYFSLDESNLLTGYSGLGVIKARTVFGFASFGLNDYHGHAFIVLRGTGCNGDKLTDINMGTSRSTTGQPVHDGFNETFYSMKGELDAFITKMLQQNIGIVHCVGHSLGGALVSLVAEHVQNVTQQQPYVYTFGAPRIGLRPFARHLTREISPERLFRVYHRTDIVPCVPFWPFVHAPLSVADSHDYFLPTPGAMPNRSWHKMDRYSDTIGSDGWGMLRRYREEPISDRQIESWLHIESPIHFTLTNLRWLDRAIAYVVTQCIKATGIGLTMALSSGFTIMDTLAYILIKGIDLSVKLTALVMRLLRKMLSFLGMRPVLDQADATRQFISSLFARLADRINRQVKAALNHALYNGQAL